MYDGRGLNKSSVGVGAAREIAPCVLDEGMDTGPVLSQRSLVVSREDTEELLAARILKEEHRLLPETLERIRQTGFTLLQRGSRRVVRWNGETPRE